MMWSLTYITPNCTHLSFSLSYGHASVPFLFIPRLSFTAFYFPHLSVGKVASSIPAHSFSLSERQLYGSFSLCWDQETTWGKFLPCFEQPVLETLAVFTAVKSLSAILYTSYLPYSSRRLSKLHKILLKAKCSEILAKSTNKYSLAKN